MGKLVEESKLYAELSEKYDNRTGEDITLELFNECVDTALTSTRREMQFVLFKLNCLYDDASLGHEKLDILNAGIKQLFGDKMKAAFMIKVLETALDEK